MNVYSDPISKAAHDALYDEIALDIQRSRNFATSKPSIGQTERDHILWLCMLLERTLLQRSQAKRYADANPLGGPARVFEAAASRIRAGENLADVMDDYGLAWTTEKTSD